jgi:XTP/dITP diphosphohydrolase
MRILIATSNPGKLRDFAGAAEVYGVEIAPLTGFSALPAVEEDGVTFEENARKKAEHYSRFAPGELVLADDSGLEVDALQGAPGVYSARYSSPNATDAENNAKLLRDLTAVPPDRRTARFVCVIAAARDGQTVATFRGEAEGQILFDQRGSGGFGYDPLFSVPEIGKTFAEFGPADKAKVSHRGRAFAKFLEWCSRTSGSVAPGP